MKMQNLKVLIADDFDNARQSLKKMLFALGVDHIDLAANGKEVIYACRHVKYDLILCDYNLGQGKNGQQVLEELRFKNELKSTALFIIISAETSRDMVMGAMECHPDEYLIKPFTQGVLKKRLEKALEQNDALAPIHQAMAAKKYDHVIELCLKSIRSQSRYRGQCRKLLMTALLASGRYDKAESLCRQLLEERDLDWAFLAEAKISLARNQIDQALKQLEDLINKFPQCIEAYDLLADCLKKKGQMDRAQKVLEMAVHISPRILERQETLAKVSVANNDLETAIKAGHQTLKLSFNSIHESPKQFFQLASILSDAAAGDPTSEGKRKAQEALSTLGQVGRKYQGQSDVELNKALLESQVYSGQGEDDKAQQCIDLAQEISGQDPELMSPEMVFELGKSYYAAGRELEAEAMLMDLVSENSNNRELVAEINAFLDEPVSSGRRIQAKNINGEGLNLYRKDEYEQALDKFQEALKLSPKHPGLNMNLIQAALKLMEKNGATHTLIELCLDAIGRIRHITEQHRQFKRYQSLKQHVAKFEERRAG